MCSIRITQPLAGLIAVLPLVLQAAASAQVSIRLDGVPEQLRMPLPDGANQVLSATIVGGQIKAVWLAMTAPSARRVLLAKVDEHEYAINLGARELHDLLKGYGPNGQFRIFAEAEDGTIVSSLAVRYTLHVVPERLDFPFDEVKLTIHQRASKKIPGSNGALKIHFGDITAGHVAVAVYGPKGEMVVDTKTMAEGDTLSLHLVEQDYVLRLDKLVNYLIGTDYGVVTLMPLHEFERNKIDDLLRAIERTDATFVRNEKEMSGKGFATHLRAKHAHYGPRNASLRTFIETVATRSSTTGEPYRVNLPGGEIVDASTWLQQQAMKFVSEPEEDSDGAAEGNQDAPP